MKKKSYVPKDPNKSYVLKDANAFSEKLEFSQRMIMHLFLVKILPGDEQNYKLNLRLQIFEGNRNECLKKKEECDEHLEKYGFKLLVRENVEQNLRQACEKHFKIKIFGSRDIEEAIDLISNKYQYKKIDTVIQDIKSKNIKFFLSVSKDKYDEFVEWYEKTKMTDYPRDIVKSLLNDYQKKKKYVRKQSTKSLSSFLKGDEGYSKPNEEQQYSTGNDIKETEQEDYYSTSFSDFSISFSSQNSKTAVETKKVQPTLQQVFAPNVLDQENITKWIKANKQLRFDEFIFKKHEDNSMTLKMIVLSNKQDKLNAINMYLKFEKVILINEVSEKSRIELQDKFRQTKDQLKCEIILGWSERGAHEHNLRKLISGNKYHQTSRRNQKFAAVWMVGLKPMVQSLQEQIRQFIDNLPMEEIVENLIIDMGEISRFLHFEKIVKLIEEVIIREIPINFQGYTAIEVKKCLGNIVVTLQIKQDKAIDFSKNEKQKILNAIQKWFVIDDSLLEVFEFTDNLKQKYHLYISEEDESKVVLVEDHSKYSATKSQITKLVKEIRAWNLEMETLEICLKQGRYSLINEQIEQVKKKDEQFNSKIRTIKIVHGNQKMSLFGPRRNVTEIHEMISSFANELEKSITYRTFTVTEKEANVIEKNIDKFKSEIDKKFKLNFNLNKEVNFGAIITYDLGKRYDNLKIFIWKNRQISKLPQQTLICFRSNDQLNFCQEKFLLKPKAIFKGNKDNLIQDDKYSYVYVDSGFIDKLALEHVIQKHPYQNTKTKNFAFFMPPKNKKQFMDCIIKIMGKLLKQNQIRVFIYEQFSVDIEKDLGMTSKVIQSAKKQKKRRFFVSDNNSNYYYSKSGDDKIEKAFKEGQSQVILANEDLKLSTPTYSCSFPQKKLVHKLTRTQFQLTVLSNKATINLNGRKIEMPQSQFQKVKDSSTGQCDISIGVYLLNFQKMIQTNLFSGFERRLQFEENDEQVVVPQGFLNVSYNEKIYEVEIPYDIKFEDEALDVEVHLKNLIESQKIVTKHEIGKEISKKQFEMIKQCGKQYDVTVTTEDYKTLTLQSFDNAGISTVQKIMKNILDTQKQEKRIEYPKYWVAQHSDIETYIVDLRSNEFQEVQRSFTLGPIKQLLRIQNKLVFEKYYQSKAQLEYLNGGRKVKEMMLFHGTRNTDPKIIYQDKEESFNINYTGDSNYLGRGTYFAVKSEYSHGYAYSEPQSMISNLLGGRRRQMFYCEVLVGESQDIKVVSALSQSMKDTDYKNAIQKIRYESATTFTQGSVIYTVYKNRRAYPHYLISY